MAQAARIAVLRVKAGQPFLKVVGAPPAAPGESLTGVSAKHGCFWSACVEAGNIECFKACILIGCSMVTRTAHGRRSAQEAL